MQSTSSHIPNTCIIYTIIATLSPKHMHKKSSRLPPCIFSIERSHTTIQEHKYKSSGVPNTLYTCFVRSPKHLYRTSFPHLRLPPCHSRLYHCPFCPFKHRFPSSPKYLNVFLHLLRPMIPKAPAQNTWLPPCLFPSQGFTLVSLLHNNNGTTHME